MAAMINRDSGTRPHPLPLLAPPPKTPALQDSETSTFRTHILLNFAFVRWQKLNKFTKFMSIFVLALLS